MVSPGAPGATTSSSAPSGGNVLLGGGGAAAYPTNVLLGPASSGLNNGDESPRSAMRVAESAHDEVPAAPATAAAARF